MLCKGERWKVLVGRATILMITIRVEEIRIRPIFGSSTASGWLAIVVILMCMSVHIISNPTSVRAISYLSNPYPRAACSFIPVHGPQNFAECQSPLADAGD